MPDLVVLHETGAINLRELCTPVAAGIFRNTDTSRGLTDGLVTSGCRLLLGRGR